MICLTSARGSLSNVSIAINRPMVIAYSAYCLFFFISAFVFVYCIFLYVCIFSFDATILVCINVAKLSVTVAEKVGYAIAGKSTRFISDQCVCFISGFWLF